MKWLNVIVDLNLFFYKYAYYLSYKHGYDYVSDEEKKKLVSSVHMGIVRGVSNLLGNGMLKSIHLATDSESSWRSEFYVKYKRDRIKDDKFDFISLLQTIKYYTRELQDKGIYVHTLNRLEGDDMIYGLVDHFKKTNENCVILTSDSDMRQLIDYKEVGFCLMYDIDSQKDIIYTDKLLEVQEAKEVDVFEVMMSDNLDDLEETSDYLLGSHMKFEEINRKRELFIKILSGDKTDNIDSVCKKPAKIPSGYMQLREKGAEKVYIDMEDTLPDDFPHRFLHDEQFRRDTASVIMGVHKYKDLTKLSEVSSNLIRNTRLIFLDKDSYPPEVAMLMETHFNKMLGDSKLKQNHREAIKNGFTNEILQGTVFYSRGTARYYNE